MNKTINLVLIIIFITSCMTAMLLTSATTAPSVPDFTVKQVDRSYETPITYTKNQYTGETITHPSYHVENLTIDIIIQNQPFIPAIINGNTTKLFYNIEAKFSNQKWSINDYPSEANKYVVEASSSGSTVVTYVLSDTGGWYVSKGNQIDIRVQAVTGYKYQVWSLGGGIIPIGTEFALDKASSWSSAKTIAVGSGEIITNPNSSTPSTAPTQFNVLNGTVTKQAANTQPESIMQVSLDQVVIAVMAVVIAALAAVVILLRRKKQ
jgi:hypothetical protein